jgi:hypothetical protein
MDDPMTHGQHDLDRCAPSPLDCLINGVGIRTFYCTDHPMSIAAAYVAFGYDPLERPLDLAHITVCRDWTRAIILSLSPADPAVDHAFAVYYALDALAATAAGRRS